jgi:hypothetical protein
MRNRQKNQLIKFSIFERFFYSVRIIQRSFFYNERNELAKTGTHPKTLFNVIRAQAEQPHYQCVIQVDGLALSRGHPGSVLTSSDGLCLEPPQRHADALASLDAGIKCRALSLGLLEHTNRGLLYASDEIPSCPTLKVVGLFAA